MKIDDCLLRYRGFSQTPGITHLRVYEHDESIVAVVGELGDNPSTSVTNAIEAVLEELRARYGPQVIVIEHYPAATELRTTATWDTVIGGDGHTPASWRRLTDKADVEALIGEPIEEWAAADYTAAALRATGRPTE